MPILEYLHEYFLGPVTLECECLKEKRKIGLLVLTYSVLEICILILGGVFF